MRQGNGVRRVGWTIGAALVLALAVTPAEAGKPRIKSTVTINSTFDAAHPEPIRFYGKVRSSKPACKRGRKIELRARIGEVMSARGPQQSGPVGATRSDKRGRWEIRLLADGLPRYVVKVKPKKKPRFTCKRARAVYQVVN